MCTLPPAPLPLQVLRARHRVLQLWSQNLRAVTAATAPLRMAAAAAAGGGGGGGAHARLVVNPASLPLQEEALRGCILQLEGLACSSRAPHARPSSCRMHPRRASSCSGGDAGFTTSRA